MAWLRETFLFLNDPLSAVIFWVVIVTAIYAFFTWLIPFLTRKSKTEIDDIIIGVLRWPVIIILIVYAILFVLSLFEQTAAWVELLHKGYLLVLIWVSTWLLYRLIRDVVAEYLKDYAEESESNLDDVAIPMIEKVGPLVIFTVALLITVGVFNPELLGGLLTVIGGLSFLLIILFQEPLSNLFSGIYLWIDTPFRIKDLIQLEDGTFYRILNIGSRVAELYNTEAHTVAFFPNNKLAEQRLINVTKPNVELRQGIDIGIAYGHSFDQIEEVQVSLTKLANAHPHVLGPWDQPTKSVPAKKKLLDDTIIELRREDNQEAREKIAFLERELKRLEIEYRMRDDNHRIWGKIKTLAALVSRLEFGGLWKKEREFIKKELDEICNDILLMRRDLTVWVRWSGMLQTFYRYDHLIDLEFQDIENSVVSTDGWLVLHEKYVDSAQRIQWLEESGKVPLIGEFGKKEELHLFGIDIFRRAYLMEKEFKASISEIHKFPIKAREHDRFDAQQRITTCDLIADYEYLIGSWSSSVRNLMRHLYRIDTMLHGHGAGEFRIDSELEKTAKQFSERFMLRVPGFRYPDADFQKYGESSIDFRLDFFVDDLVGEHFERTGDVVSEVGTMIKEKFDVSKIEIPFPQRDIWFRNLSQEIATSNMVVQPRSGRKAHK